MSSIEAEGGTQHGSEGSARAGTLRNSHFLGQTVFFFSLPGEASAVLAKAKAKAEAIRILASALTQHNGDAAASLTVAEKYVNAFSKLAKDSNTVLLPSNPSDVTSMVAQAMGVYGALTKTPVPGAQNSSENSRDVQSTDASLEELGRVKLS